MTDSFPKVYNLTEWAYHLNDKRYVTCQTSDKRFVCWQTLFVYHLTWQTCLLCYFILTDRFPIGFEIDRQLLLRHLTCQTHFSGALHLTDRGSKFARQFSETNLPWQTNLWNMHTLPDKICNSLKLPDINPILSNLTDNKNLSWQTQIFVYITWQTVYLCSVTQSKMLSVKLKLQKTWCLSSLKVSTFCLSR